MDTTLEGSSTLRAFCKRHSISLTMWYKLLKSDRAPAFYRLGSKKILITASAEAAWLKARQSPALDEAEAIQASVEGLTEQNRKSSAKSLTTGNHTSVKRAAKNKAGA